MNEPIEQQNEEKSDKHRHDCVTQKMIPHPHFVNSHYPSQYESTYCRNASIPRRIE
jgi:hypothetical protein